MASVARNASATEMRLLAESSSVRSSHWVDAVSAGFVASAMTYRAREQMRSLRMGFRLYAMAEDPIWVFSNGSSSSFMCCSSRRSLANLEADCAMPDSTLQTW